MKSGTDACVDRLRRSAQCRKHTKGTNRVARKSPVKKGKGEASRMCKGCCWLLKEVGVVPVRSSVWISIFLIEKLKDLYTTPEGEIGASRWRKRHKKLLRCVGVRFEFLTESTVNASGAQSCAFLNGRRVKRTLESKLIKMKRTTASIKAA